MGKNKDKKLKINNIKIKGLRGFKNEVDILLDSKSFIVYGDNGSGKSSIIDSIEWFYFNELKNIKGEEVSKIGEVVRNTLLKDDELSFVELEFTNKAYNAKKTIDSKYKINLIKSNNETEKYIEESKNENFILRYKQLSGFIEATKKTRLDDISLIIGFEELTKYTKEIKRALAEIKKQIKIKDFENQIANRQNRIVENLSVHTTDDKSFYKGINNTLTEIGIKENVSSVSEVDELINSIGDVDKQIVNSINFYNSVTDNLKLVQTNIKKLEDPYKEYYEKFISLKGNIDELKNIIMKEFLVEAKKVLSNKNFENTDCPLCQQPIDKVKLTKDVEDKIKQLKEYEKKYNELGGQKSAITDGCSKILDLLNALLLHKQLESDENTDIKSRVGVIQSLLNDCIKNISTDIHSDKILDKPPLFSEEKIDINDIAKSCEGKAKELDKKIQGGKKANVIKKIAIAIENYKQINILKIEKDILELQRNSLDKITDLLLKKHKEELDKFLKEFSGEINWIFSYLNPKERVENFKLVPVGNEDDFTGISIEFDFYGKKQNPPHKYLSESQLHCLGIAFFLTSTKALNKKNGFIIFDDVISSFDRSHRRKFASLLDEHYQDYQIIVLTHERDWYDIFLSIVKGQDNWITKIVNKDPEYGSYISEHDKELKLKIEDCISKNIVEDTGIKMRRYFESILKKIMIDIEAQVQYKPGSENDDRTPRELLTSVQSRIKKQSSDELNKHNDIHKISTAPSFILNKESHDTGFQTNMGELKGVWEDIKAFENLFLCSTCNFYISVKNYDSVNKKIRCRCKEDIKGLEGSENGSTYKGLRYSWKS